MKILKIAAFALLLLTLWTSPSFAQSDRGTLTGTVTDPSGAVVADAKVTATNLDTGEVREATTSGEGSYTMPELSADPYRVTVEAAGFKTATIENIQIAVQVTRTADIQLEVGGAGETVTVVAEAQTIQTETAVQQTNISERQVRELPLLTGIDTSGRTPLSFIFLDSNVVDASGSSRGASANQFKVNGGQALGTEILIDGVATRRAQNGTFFGEVSPSPNAFQEFTISTSNFSAEFGNTSGGIVNFTVKSGSNEFHGEAYELFLDEALSANGFINNANGLSRPPFQKNDFGGNIGGPIYLPRFGEGGPVLLSGKNRAFFFFNYNGFRFNQTENVFISVPTLRMREGDFGELLTDSYVRQFFGGGVQIYDPTASPGAGRPAIPNNDFRGYRNAAGQSVIDPVGANILRFFPLPTREGVYRNFLATSTKPEETNEFTGKTDFVIGDSQRLAFSYAYRRRFSLQGQGGNAGFRRFPGEVPAVSVFEQPFRSHFARLIYDYTITPTILNHFNAGFTRYFVSNRNLTQDEIDPVSLGFRPSSTQRRAFPIAGFPGYGDVITSPDPRSYQGIGSTFFSDVLGDNAVQFSDFVTYVRGRQTMKFGADIRNQQFNVTQLIHPGGEFNFRNNQTSRDNENNGGWPIASLITGATEFSFNSVQTIAPAYRQFSQSYFFADDIKATQKLTLNVGVRYDLPGLRREAGNRFRTFDPNAVNPVVGRRGAIISANATGALQAEFETLAKPDRSNIGPRFGFAYSLNNRTVVRGGAGLYYAPIIYGFGGQNNLTEGTIGYNTLGGPNINFDAEARPENFLRNYRDIPPIDPFGQFVGSDVDFFQRDFKTGRTFQYSVDMQRQLPYNFVVQLGYVGNRGTRLRSDFNRINGLPLETLRLGNSILFKPLRDVNADDRAYASSVGITLPTNRDAVFSGFDGSVADSLRPFPQYRFIRNQLESEGQSFYNAGTVKLDRRFAQGIQFGLSYTFSKVITDAAEDLFGGTRIGGLVQNPNNRRALRGVSPNDVPHVFVVNYLFELPFGKGKRFVDQGGIVNTLLGGFQISGIQRYQSGRPLVISNSRGTRFLSVEGLGFQGDLRPNLTGQPILTDNPRSGTSFRVLNANAFAFPTDFGAPPTGDVRDPRYAAFYADPQRFLGNAPIVYDDIRPFPFSIENVNLLKKTRLTETMSIELGIEAFNIFNRTRFFDPSGNIDAGDFGFAGRNSSFTEFTPRQVQLRARFIF